MSDMTLIMGVLLIIIVISSFALAVFLRDSRGNRYESHHSQTDLTNMMIMFQTMRDVVSEQKDLARQFNASLDKKVALVRDAMEAVTKERETLDKTRKELQHLVDAAKREMGELRDHRGSAPPVDKAEESAAEPEAERPPPQARAEEEALPPLRAFPENPPDDNEDLIDSWTGLDFGGDSPGKDEFEVPESVGDETDDAETARAAFRSLLDMEPADAQEPNSPAGSGNGHHQATPLQRRVYEYNDAGMTVADIARELGVGKGEVRLILSLRQDKEA